MRRRFKQKVETIKYLYVLNCTACIQNIANTLHIKLVFFYVRCDTMIQKAGVSFMLDIDIADREWLALNWHLIIGCASPILGLINKQHGAEKVIKNIVQIRYSEYQKYYLITGSASPGGSE